MPDITKTQGIAILAHQAITHPNSVVGAAQDVSAKLAGTIVMYHSSVEEVANTNAGKFVVLISPSSSGDEDWAIFAEFPCTASTSNREALSSATEPTSEVPAVLQVASTTGYASGGKVYVQDINTITDGEWALVKRIVANTSIDLFYGLTTQKDNADFVWNDADIFVCPMDFTNIGRVAVAFLHEGATGANCHIKAIMVTGDAIE